MMSEGHELTEEVAQMKSSGGLGPAALCVRLFVQVVRVSAVAESGAELDPLESNFRT